MSTTHSTAAVERPRRWADVRATAAHTGIAITTLNTWRCIDPKRIPFHRINRTIRYDLNEVDDAIAGTGPESK